MNGFREEVRFVSSLTRSGSSIGQSESIVNAIRMRLEDAGHRVIGVPIVYEDLDGGSEERGSWDAEREQANAHYAAARADVLAYIGTLDTDAAPYSIPITNAADLLMISPCNTYPGLTKPFEPGEPDKHYPTGRRNYLRTALSDDLQGLFAAQWAAELGVQRVFVLHDTEPCGRGVALPFADACRQLGVELSNRRWGSSRSSPSTRHWLERSRTAAPTLSSTAASSKTEPGHCGATSVPQRRESR